MIKKSMRCAALVLTAAMLLTACGGGKKDTGKKTSGKVTQGSENSENSENNGEKVLKLYLTDTPETFNPHTTASNYELLLDMTATLYREIYDEENEQTSFVPSLADGEPVSEDDDHKVWTIKVKDGYAFADGTPIDAHTVEYSIKMLNDPKLANRNVDASSFENGEKYLLGECDWSEVGFKATDDNTIQVTYAENYEPEGTKDVKELFAFIGTGMVKQELYESCLSADGTECSYGSSLDKFMASALYEPSDLIQGQYLELTRRTDGKAPLEDVFTPDKVEYYAIADTNTAVQMFEKGELDAVIANQTAYDEYPNAHYVYTADNFGIFINSETPTCEALKDVNLRYALYWGLDRENVVKAVFPTAIPSAYQYLPFATMPDPEDKENKKLDYYETKEAKAVRMDGHEITQSGYDPELAKEYFDKAYAANGGKITIKALYSDTNDVSKTWAEALQSAWQKMFGEDKLEISLQATPGAIIYEEISREKMNYDICVSCGWYNNAEAPWNNTNWVYSGPYVYNTQYCVIGDDNLAKQWDELFYKCAMYDWRWDAQKKLEATAKMEEILYNDCSFIPAYSRGNRYFFSSKITPIMETGDVDLLFCLMQSKFN